MQPPTTTQQKQRFSNAMHVKTIIVGGGLCGVNLACWLEEYNEEYLILERQTLLHQWRDARWACFKLNSPHKFNRLHGQKDEIPDLSHRHEFARVLACWEEHIAKMNLKYKEGMTVVAVTKKDGGGFDLNIESQEVGAQKKTLMTCTNLVVCTGAYAKGKIPNMAEKLKPSIISMHSKEFRSPNQFPKDMPILVVGSGQSGVQIADVLADAGKNVYLCTSKTKGAFRSYRNQDIFIWLERMGTLDFTNQMREALPAPQAQAMKYRKDPILGSEHSISYFSLHRKGVKVLGSLEDVDGHELKIKSNRIENIQTAMDSYKNLVVEVERWIAKQPEEVQQSYAPAMFTHEDGIHEREWITEPELLESNGPATVPLTEIQGVVWCTGYTSDFSWLLIPDALENDFDKVTGMPDQLKSKFVSGLYYSGFPWVHKLGSHVIPGFERDHEDLVPMMLNERN